MSERGLPPDSSLACPFLAFEDDRDARSTRPDPRHRCFAELRPAPRAPAHQEAYCLSAGFAACPTFVDWARREAARARPPVKSAAVEAPAVASPAIETLAVEARDTTPPPAGARPAPDQGSVAEPWPQRDPHGDWAAPPPWAASAAATGATGIAGGQGDRPERPSEAPGPPPTPATAAAPDVEAPSFLATRGAEPPRPAPATATHPQSAHAPTDLDDELEAAQGDDEGWAEPETEEPPMRRFGPVAGRTRYDDTASTNRREPPRRRPPADAAAPSWEKPRRLEAYPTLRTRAGLPNISPLLGAGIVIVLAAAALFFIPPLLLGLGGDGDASPRPSGSGATASATPEGSPTLPPAPTPFSYVVKSGDTLSKIAKEFGVTLDALIAANAATLPDPDKLQVGDKLIIPTGDAEPSPEAPSPSP